jgi:hypothetical protein
MLRKLLILDAALVSLLVIGGLKFRQDWRAFGPSHDLSLIQPGRLTLPTMPGTGVSGSQQSGDWTDIAARNPFSFDRTDIDIVVAEAPPPKPAGPKPILFGTMLIGKDRTAVVAPGANANGAARPMRLGDAIDGWTIVEIAKSSIQIESNGIRQSVITNDPMAQIPKDYGKTPGPAPTSPSVIQTSQPPTIATPQPSPAPGTVAPTSPEQPKRRIVRTPFGNIVVDEP